MQQQAGESSVKETITGQIVSISNFDKCKVNNKVNKNCLLQNVLSLQLRVNNLNVAEKKTLYARCKVKQRNLFGLALIDMGNLVHSPIVSGKFWEAIGEKISNSMDDGQNEGLQVLGIGT